MSRSGTSSARDSVDDRAVSYSRLDVPTHGDSDDEVVVEVDPAGAGGADGGVAMNARIVSRVPLAAELAVFTPEFISTLPTPIATLVGGDRLAKDIIQIHGLVRCGTRGPRTFTLPLGSDVDLLELIDLPQFIDSSMRPPPRLGEDCYAVVIPAYLQVRHALADRLAYSTRVCVKCLGTNLVYVPNESDRTCTPVFIGNAGDPRIHWAMYTTQTQDAPSRSVTMHMFFSAPMAAALLACDCGADYARIKPIFEQQSLVTKSAEPFPLVSVHTSLFYEACVRMYQQTVDIRTFDGQFWEPRQPDLDAITKMADDCAAKPTGPWVCMERATQTQPVQPHAKSQRISIRLDPFSCDVDIAREQVRYIRATIYAEFYILWVPRRPAAPSA